MRTFFPGTIAGDSQRDLTYRSPTGTAIHCPQPPEGARASVAAQAGSADASSGVELPRASQRRALLARPAGRGAFATATVEAPAEAPASPRASERDTTGRGQHPGSAAIRSGAGDPARRQARPEAPSPADRACQAGARVAPRAGAGWRRACHGRRPVRAGRPRAAGRRGPDPREDARSLRQRRASRFGSSSSLPVAPQGVSGYEPLGVLRTLPSEHVDVLALQRRGRDEKRFHLLLYARRQVERAHELVCARGFGGYHQQAIVALPSSALLGLIDLHDS